MHYVRHRSKPEWGVGRVIDENADTIRIEFPGKVVTLKSAIAAPLLEEVTAEDFAQRRAGVRAPAPQTPAPALNRPCITCAAPLRRSQQSVDGAWKSCTQCSAQDGREHVFRPYPEAFGDVASPGTDTSDNGEALCLACRGTGERRVQRRCSQLARAQNLARASG